MFNTIISPDQLSKCHHFFGSQDLIIKAVNLGHLQEEMSPTYLTREEQQRFDSFTYKKRKFEWLGGRIAAKTAASRLLKQSTRVDWLDWQVHPNETGRPYIFYKQSPGPDISISHSGSLAAALTIRGTSCGLDIQEINPTVVKVKERFADPAECDLLTNCVDTLSQEEALSLLWSAKESLRKAVQCQPLLGFKEVSLVEIGGGHDNGFTWQFHCRHHQSPKSLPVFAFIKKSLNMACALTLIID